MMSTPFNIFVYFQILSNTFKYFQILINTPSWTIDQKLELLHIHTHEKVYQKLELLHMHTHEKSIKGCRSYTYTPMSLHVHTHEKVNQKLEILHVHTHEKVYQKLEILHVHSHEKVYQKPGILHLHTHEKVDQQLKILHIYTHEKLDQKLEILHIRPWEECRAISINNCPWFFLISLGIYGYLVPYLAPWCMSFCISVQQRRDIDSNNYGVILSIGLYWGTQSFTLYPCVPYGARPRFSCAFHIKWSS